jgi:hypothetical protein
MSKRFASVAFAALAALLVAACGKQESGAPAVAVDTNSPDATIRHNVELLKQGDLGALMQNALPPADFAELKAEWGKDKQPPTDEERQKFADTMARLTAPDADKTIYAEIEPQLKQFDAQYQQQMPMYVAMGSGWLQGMVQQSKELSDADKQQAVAAINALAAWVQKTHFTDAESIKKVLAIGTKAARDLNMKTLDEVQALNFDQSMQKAHIAMFAFRDALNVYGFSVDKTLDSVKPEVVSNDGNVATVKVSYTLLDTPLSMTTQMVKQDGHWYGKDTIDRVRERKEEAAKEAAEAASATLPSATSTPPAAPAPETPSGH